MTDSDKRQFIYTFEPVRPEFRNPETRTPEENATAARHVAYQQTAMERAQVILLGRSLDGIGPAVIIFEADSPEAGNAFVESDPFVAEGVMRASLHPFHALFVRSENRT